jgi:hypothetical protein
LQLDELVVDLLHQLRHLIRLHLVVVEVRLDNPGGQLDEGRIREGIVVFLVDHGSVVPAIVMGTNVVARDLKNHDRIVDGFVF